MAARDLDGKWAWYRKNIGDDDEKYTGLVSLLARRTDFDFLEALALYEIEGQRRTAAAQALATAGAQGKIKTRAKEG